MHLTFISSTEKIWAQVDCYNKKYNLLLVADVKQRKENILNNEPNSDNCP